MATAHDQTPLRFGIPSLDNLIGTRDGGSSSDPDDQGFWLVPNEASSVCIIGPDGTGKSLLSLHLASEYACRVGDEPVKIIYASTDLSQERASKMWSRFWLDRPRLRRECLPFQPGQTPPNRPELGEPELKLNSLLPEPAAMAGYLADSKPCKEVAFLDLASATSGDDWHLLNTILGTLDTPKNGHRHMLLIDAIEGLETLVGGRDALGEEQERRARVAHILRAASRKCHLVFVVEEPKDGSRLPEVFVADMVVRLRTEMDRDYARRTVEFEKVRGQAHVRGQHDFRIRQAPEKPGEAFHADEPAVGVYVPDEKGTLHFPSHLVVFPSLHEQGRYLPKERETQKPDGSDESWRYSGFGIYQLDSMLAQPRNPSRGLPGDSGTDPRGLPRGTLTALIGNEGTYKSRLAHAFLSQSFRDRSGELKRVSDPLGLVGQGVSVLLTTADMSQSKLTEVLKYHLIAGQDVGTRTWQAHGLREQLVVRRLDAHYLPAPVLMHMVKALIDKAKDLLYRNCPEQRKDGLHNWRIRFVVDDWSEMLRNYPEAARDPLLIPQLTTLLRREGVSALMLATHTTTAEELRGQLLDKAKRIPCDNYLFTWPVSFYGERRVAITALPSLSPRSENVIRELRRGRVAELPGIRLCDTRTETVADQADQQDQLRRRADRETVVDKEGLVVDPHFELYDRLDEGRPQPIGLQVRLFAEHESMSAFNSYVQEMDEVFQQVFGHGTAKARIEALHGAAYDRLREHSHLQSESRLDQTVVLQVDEFWSESRSELHRQDRYLEARTVDRDGRQITAEDPFGLFQASTTSTPDSGELRMNRSEFFELVGNDLEECMKRFPVDKVPYAWDFGFLLCNHRAWDRAAKQSDHRTDNPYLRENGMSVSQRVGDIWHRLWKISRPYETGFYNQSFGEVRESPTAHFMQTMLLEEAKETAEIEQKTKALNETEKLAKDSTDAEVKRKAKADAKKLAKEIADAEAKLNARATSDRYPKFTAKSTTSPQSLAGQERRVDAVTWREFLGACKTVAHHTRYEFPPFDVDLLATESFSCFILEVWFSEWWLAVKSQGKTGIDPSAFAAVDRDALKQENADPGADDPASPRPRREQTVSKSLRERIADPEFRSALYRTALLVDEVLHPRQLEQDNLALKPRAGIPMAAACRHWYPTASAAMADAAARRDWIAVGLPGHYSVRGDWFLGIAKGSRSPRLGERAMDILGSRRANVVRLQTGLGLPVRDLHPSKEDLDKEPVSCPQDRRETRTALIYTTADGEEENIRYSDLRKLGAWDEKDGLGRQRDFRWLWRSNLKHYDLHARIWQKWICLLFTNWRTWPRPKDHWDGFKEYDHWVAKVIHDKSNENPFMNDSDRWERFEEMCEVLQHALDRATPKHPH